MLTLKLEDIPEEGLELKWKEEMPILSGYLETLSQIDFEFETPLESEAKVKKIGQTVLVNGKVKTVLHLHCVRCLREFSYPLSSQYEMTLHSPEREALAEELDLSVKDLESNFFEGGEIHLSEIACEQVFLEIPVQPLCQEGCRGLCPTCGKDLNLSACGCPREELEAGFSALQKLKLQGRE